MKVKELKKLLDQFDDEMSVVFNDYKSNSNDPIDYNIRECFISFSPQLNQKSIYLA